MTNTIQMSLAAIASSSLAFLMTTAGIDTVQRATEAPSPRSLQITELVYDNEKFIQSSRVVGSNQIRGLWAAKITRGDSILCSGGAVSTYTGRTVLMTPDQWTGDECPALKTGDLASASWEWQDENGFVHIIAKQIEIGSEG